MKIVQKASIEIMVENIKKAIRCFDIDPSKTYLSIVGGYGLNCPTNSYLMEHFQFKGYLAPPCVNDGGIALGKGLYRFYLDDPKIQFHFNSAYYGDADNNLDAVTQSTAFSSFIDKIEAFNLEQVIRDIQHYPIVWFDGRAEIGPRSLGNRSLLGDPRKQLTKDRLNHIKKRELWRPVAPVFNRHLCYTPFLLRRKKGIWFLRFVILIILQEFKQPMLRINPLFIKFFISFIRLPVFPFCAILR